LALNTCGAKRSQRPVKPSASLNRSGELLEAMHTCRPLAFTASTTAAMPCTARNSRPKTSSTSAAQRAA